MRFVIIMWLVLASILLFCPPESHAQSQPTSASRVALRGAVFGGGLWDESNVLPHFGGAIEFGILPRVSLGGQAGIAIDREDKALSLLMSARVQYSFANPSTAQSAWAPFVAAGLTRAVYLENGFNVAAGAEYWGRNQFGLRFEALAHVFGSSGRWVEFRAGVVFRRSAKERP
jgi:hypothetical protein